MEVQFNDIKNHDVLSGQITKKLELTKHICDCITSEKQVEKFKETIKKVVDDNSQTGNKATTCKFL